MRRQPTKSNPYPNRVIPPNPRGFSEGWVNASGVPIFGRVQVEKNYLGEIYTECYNDSLVMDRETLLVREDGSAVYVWCIRSAVTGEFAEEGLTNGTDAFSAFKEGGQVFVPF